IRGGGWGELLSIRSIRDSAFTLLGTGNIGVNAAQRLRGMGAGTLTGISRSGRSHPAFDQVVPMTQLEEILPQTHVLIMSLPDTAETRRALNRDRIALLPPDAFVINVGRGTAIDQEALAEALNGGKLAGAALDVTDPEPLPQDHPLWTAKNLILTPHASGNLTLGYTRDLNVDMFCQDLARYAAGEPLQGLVDRSRGY
ncbi:MAG: D-2-hydroxyacid dehydrogenase, partial [Oscillibacter sp.]|nr:D-2-hydroxyacid dehydrogenase [Oscillibacter sp.]